MMRTGNMVQGYNSYDREIIMNVLKNKINTIIFAVAGYNLAETGRHIEIAKACKDLFNVIFISYGGKFESLIEEDKVIMSNFDLGIIRGLK